ncbi:MAG: hypothetical protein ACI9U2_002117 [Bradymonadia bacterium]
MVDQLFGVLKVGGTPERARGIGWSMIEVGGGTILIGLILIAFLRRRWRKADA